MSITISGRLSLTLQDSKDTLPNNVQSRITRTIISKDLISSAGTELKEYNGTYTPNNDTFGVATFGSDHETNLIVIITDKPIGVQIAGVGTTTSPLLESVTIDGLMVLTMKTPTPGYVSQITFDARSSSATNYAAIQQNVPLNYYIAVVSGGSFQI